MGTTLRVSLQAVKEIINYFNTSLKSSNESKLWLAILKDTKKIKDDEAIPLLKELKEISNILAASILTLKNKR